MFMTAPGDVIFEAEVHTVHLYDEYGKNNNFKPFPSKLVTSQLELSLDTIGECKRFMTPFRLQTCWSELGTLHENLQLCTKLEYSTIENRGKRKCHYSMFTRYIQTPLSTTLP